MIVKTIAPAFAASLTLIHQKQAFDIYVWCPANTKARRHE